MATKNIQTSPDTAECPRVVKLTCIWESLPPRPSMELWRCEQGWLSVGTCERGPDNPYHSFSNWQQKPGVHSGGWLWRQRTEWWQSGLSDLSCHLTGGNHIRSPGANLTTGNCRWRRVSQTLNFPSLILKTGDNNGNPGRAVVKTD